MVWQLQKARNQFSQVINLAVDDGPQIVTRYGNQVAVVLSIQEYEMLINPRKTLIQALLSSPLINSDLDIERSQNMTMRPLAL